MEVDDDDDYEEKEITVYLDFESYVSPEELERAGIQFKIIGIDSDHPIVQVNGKLFKGTYDFCLGTNLFFEEDPNPPVVDPLFDITPNVYYRFYEKTQKVLKMERIFVEKLRARDEASDCDVIAELKVRKQPNMTYAEALNLLLPEDCPPPRVLPPDPLPMISLPDPEKSKDSKENQAKKDKDAEKNKK